MVISEALVSSASSWTVAPPESLTAFAISPCRSALLMTGLNTIRKQTCKMFITALFKHIICSLRYAAWNVRFEPLVRRPMSTSSCAAP